MNKIAGLNENTYIAFLGVFKFQTWARFLCCIDSLCIVGRLKRPSAYYEVGLANASQSNAHHCHYTLTKRLEFRLFDLCVYISTQLFNMDNIYELITTRNMYGFMQYIRCERNDNLLQISVCVCSMFNATVSRVKRSRGCLPLRGCAERRVGLLT